MLSDDPSAEGTAPAGGREPAANRVTVLVCSSCRDADGSDGRPRPGETLAERLHTLAAGAFPVEPVECLGNCKRRLSAALVTPDAWTYVFGDLGPDSGADLLAGASLLAASADGLLPWRGRPDALKRGLVARIPPLFPRKDAS